MSAEIKLNQDATCLTVSGDLNVNTVAPLRVTGTQLLKTLSDPTFDLQHITHCDSSALALLTAWARDCKKINKHAKFINVPAQLMEMAQLSNLNKVLALEASPII